MRTLLRIAFYVWPVITALAVWMAISQLAGSTATELVCDRRADTCEQHGGSQEKLPPPSRLVGAVLRVQHIHREGDERYVTLIFRDGTRKDIGPYAAQDDRAIASYQHTVDEITDFIRHPEMERVDTTFTYRASLGEKVSAVMGLVLVLAIQVVMLVVWLGSRASRRASSRSASA